jgi:release factor glutamine methyltransferase
MVASKLTCAVLSPPYTSIIKNQTLLFYGQSAYYGPMSEDNYTKEITWLLKEKYQGKMSDEALADIERIKKGEPVAYVIGFVDFLGSKIDLSEKPLIPRAETEFWVEKAIEDLNGCQADSQIKCLDIFAGSGCIGISILKHVSSPTVDFVDVENNALKQIKINCDLNNIDPTRYHIQHSNILENVGMLYDYIFANPPYIAEDKKNDVQELVLNYEPHQALFSGTDGLDIIRIFLKEVPKHLNKAGKLYMEFDDHQKDAIEQILKENNFNKYEFYQDQFKKWRYLGARKNHP